MFAAIIRSRIELHLPAVSFIRYTESQLSLYLEELGVGYIDLSNRVVIYTVEIIIQEEKLQHASKQFPSYFRRAMSMLSKGEEYGYHFRITFSWKDIWRRYELMERSKSRVSHCNSSFVFS